ncbi:MAG: hypothetical protein HUU50_06250 [Candidatus Brocadiae bacterium]|nr:hypothetical protein [Candidatus Brocadiia bacterium]
MKKQTAFQYLMIFSFFCIIFLCSCGGKYTREFSPKELVSENSMVKLSVDKVLFKKGNLRVWGTLENKTDQSIMLSYGSFKIKVLDTVYPGALRVPFVRVTKDFPLEPKMLKKLPGPIEALQVAPASRGSLILDIPGGSSVSVDFPMSE